MPTSLCRRSPRPLPDRRHLTDRSTPKNLLPKILHRESFSRANSDSACYGLTDSYRHPTPPSPASRNPELCYPLAPSSTSFPSLRLAQRPRRRPFENGRTRRPDRGTTTLGGDTLPRGITPRCKGKRRSHLFFRDALCVKKGITFSFPYVWV